MACSRDAQAGSRRPGLSDLPDGPLCLIADELGVFDRQAV